MRLRLPGGLRMHQVFDVVQQGSGIKADQGRIAFHNAHCLRPCRKRTDGASLERRDDMGSRSQPTCKILPCQLHAVASILKQTAQALVVRLFGDFRLPGSRRSDPKTSRYRGYVQASSEVCSKSVCHSPGTRQQLAR